MAHLVSADLSAACSALGHFDVKKNKYFADSNSLETVKDLIRYLRRDDDTFDIRRQLGTSLVLQSDLLPMLKSYWEETDLFDVLLRLIVNLTTPALILWNEEMPTEKTARNYYLQIEDHLQRYKEAFADEEVWAVLSTRLSKILEIEYAHRGDENSLIIERILILIRNILYVAADTSENRPDNDASIHDQVLWALHQSGMLDIILYISSSPQEHAYYLHILEILSFMLREQRPSELANAALQRSQTEKVRDEAELLAIRNREIQEKQKKVKSFAGTRHSRFGGTFVVKSMKSINDENDLIYHKPLNKLDSLTFDTTKQNPKTPRNRMPVKATPVERRSAFSIRLFLKEFCVEFLNGSYNTIMRYVKDSLARNRGAQQNDSSYYLWALRFFMEFNRYYKFDIKLVSETMSVQSFHYVQQQGENFYDQIASDKKRFRIWGKRLHLALLAYKELFLTLSAMDKSTDSSVRDSSKVIKNNIFYMMEYREFILVLLVNYDELKMSDLYLKDLIETQHIFLKLLEDFCAKEGTVIVQSKGRRKSRKKRPNKAVSKVPQKLDLDALWDEVGPQLSSVLESVTNFPTDVAPFDAASDVPIDEQKADAMKNIQRKLRSLDFEGAIGLFHAAREVWPENDSFGAANMAPEEEFLALRDVFYADLGENEVALNPSNDSDPDDNNSDIDDEDEDEQTHYNESSFKFQDFLKRLVHPKVVRACGLALNNFDTNSVHTNHCIIKLLHRIAFDCKTYVMCFQLSLFMTFQRIFQMKDLPQHKELVKFATYIVRQFVKVSETNKKVFMEALFWKSAAECYEIESGYTQSGERSEAAQKMWSEEQEDEIRRLFMEHQETNQEEDVVDWILHNLIDTNRTRRGLLKKMKEMHLIVDYKGKKKSGNRAPKNWSQEEEENLKELFEECKDSDDPLGFIMENMEVARPRNRIVDKLLIMGLVQDRKELRKKRSKKSNNSRSGGAGSALSEANSDDETRSHPSSAPQKKQNKNPRNIAKSSTSTQKKKKSQPNVSKKELYRMILDVMEKEMHEALEWLKDSLSDAIEDYEEEGSEEGIPLVPLMDYAESAMENDAFLKMLKGFGCSAPSDEQETYWRIPGYLKPETLQSLCDLIQQALDKTLVIPDDLENDEILDNNDKENNSGNDSDSESSGVEDNIGKPQNNTKSSDEEDVFDRIRKIQKPVSPKSDTVFTCGEMRENEGGEDTLKIGVDKKVSRKSKIIRSSSSDSENDESEMESAKEDMQEVNEEHSSSPKKSGRHVLDSDSDSNVDEIEKKVRDENKSKSRALDSDSDIDDVTNDLNNSDSDIDKNDLQNGKANRSKSKVLDSDSEEDVTNNSNESRTKSKVLESNSEVEEKDVLKRVRTGSDSDLNNSDSDIDKNVSHQSEKKVGDENKSKSRALDSDSDIDDVANDLNNSDSDIDKNDLQNGKANRSKSKVLDSDSEEDVTNNSNESRTKSKVLESNSEVEEKDVLKRVRTGSDSDLNNSDSDIDKNVSHQSEKKVGDENKSKSRALDSDSDIDDVANDLNNSDSDIDKNDLQDGKANRSKSKVLDSDSEEDVTNDSNESRTKSKVLESNSEVEEEDVLKRVRTGSDSDLDKPASKKSRLIESDED